MSVTNVRRWLSLPFGLFSNMAGIIRELKCCMLPKIFDVATSCTKNLDFAFVSNRGQVQHI
jgi:hypothetical protein